MQGVSVGKLLGKFVGAGEVAPLNRDNESSLKLSADNL